MAPRLVLHKATVAPGEVYYFLARPETYTGDISTATGVEKAGTNEQDRPPTAVAALVSNGKLFRLIGSYTTGTKKRTVKFLCTKGKLSTAFDSLNGKTYTGGLGSGTLSAIRISQKATFF